MKNKTILRITDYVNCKFENLDPLTRRKMIDETKHFIPSSRYMPAYKLGRWDGCKAFATMGGATYINMLDQIIPIVEKAGYDIELVDEREPIDFEFPEVDEFLLSDIFWPDGHPYAGEPIMLRDHQVRAIQSFFDNPQSMQEIATSAGKCLTAETKLKIFHNGVAPITESVGSLFDYIERTFDIEFKDNEEVDVSELNMEIDTPGYKTLITHLIKKFSLPIIKVTFTDNSTIRVSERHMFVLENGNTIQSSFLLNGSRIQTRNGTIEVEKIERDGIEDCYDISIEEPHLYYDANDILHHNTIITGALCKLVEDHGRTITIVPSKSLVVQTEVDYRNIGLDTGVFYGEKKEENKHHTIMTWQSLSSAWKNRHDDDGELFLSLIDGVVAVIVDECFAPDTQVLTPKGYVNIQDIKAGDVVINYCEETKEFKEDIVVKLHTNLTSSASEEMYELTLEDGSIIEVTGNHKFLTTDGWKRVDELTEFDDIIDYGE